MPGGERGLHSDGGGSGRDGCAARWPLAWTRRQGTGGCAALGAGGEAGRGRGALLPISRVTVPLTSGGFGFIPWREDFIFITACSAMELE